MPEGDTVFKTRAVLARALEGSSLLSFRRRVYGRLEDATEDLRGRVVDAVEARGKNLLFHLSGGVALHSHLKLTGSWHVYRPRERWRRPIDRATAVLETERAIAVLFGRATVRRMRADALRSDRALSRLGPDLTASDCDLDDALRRLERTGECAIAEALLDQSVVAGIGNVYKSEVLFVCGVHPWTSTVRLGRALRRAVLERARELLRSNLEGFARVTRSSDGGRLWVYGRSGAPCFRCAAPIEWRRQGRGARSTYWCPECQTKSTESVDL